MMIILHFIYNSTSNSLHLLPNVKHLLELLVILLSFILIISTSYDRFSLIGHDGYKCREQSINSKFPGMVRFRSNWKSFKNAGPPSEVDHFSQLDQFD